MKKEIASLMVLLALCIPALAADMPDMVGNWTGTFNGVGFLKNTHWMTSGNATYWEAENTLIIEEQNGTRFVGTMTSAENPLQTETVLGIISSDNESITLVDEDGYLWGVVLSPTEIELFEQAIDKDSMSVSAGIFTKE